MLSFVAFFFSYCIYCKCMLYLYFERKKKIIKLKKNKDVWNGIKSKIKEINVSHWDYEKDFMKIKFNSDDDLSLNKPLKFQAMNILIRSVFEEDGKLYPQVFLDDALYEV